MIPAFAWRAARERSTPLRAVLCRSRMTGETHLEQAERHVREIEEAIVGQKATVAEMEQDGDAAILAQARRLLANMEETLRVARNHLEIERTRDSHRRRSGRILRAGS
jgi:hypothetical protein